MSDSVEKTLVTYMRRGVMVGLGVDPSQTSISIRKMRDAAWVNWPHYQVVPGNVRPDGAGQGSQEGGSLIRKQRVMIYVFTKAKLAEHGMSGDQLTDPVFGIMDQFEALRYLFSHTYFGDGANTFLLSERLWFSYEGDVAWEDEENGIVSREFAWEAQYSIPEPTKITLSLPDVINDPA